MHPHSALKMALVVAAALFAPVAAASVPSIAELTSKWVDPNAVVSEQASLTAEQRDLATINNFWGAVGIAPEGTRPVDMFAVNSLELPPFAGCGANPDSAPFGCGRMLVDGAQVGAAATRWATHEAGRRSAPLPSGVTVESATRMPFEANGVLWEINFTSTKAATIRVDFELSSMVNRLSTVGTWVYPAINTPSAFNYSALTGGAQKGSLSCGGGGKNGRGMGTSVGSRSACSRYTFIGKQPDTISLPAPPPPAPPPPSSCSIAGKWVQESSKDVFGPIVEDSGSHSFAWAHNPKYTTEGWTHFNGTISGTLITLKYYRTYDVTKKRPMPVQVVHEHGSFDGDCDHIQMADSAWHRLGSKPRSAGGGGPSPVPNATFAKLVIAAGETVTLKVALAVGEDAAAAATAEAGFAKDEATFDKEWAAAHDKWQQRWEQAFTPDSGFWSGNLPTLTLDPGSASAAGVARVFYMSVLTVVSQMRTNLPLIFERVWPNGNGNVGHTTMGIGGSRSWWWDESLTSLMLALLEPASRQPTFQAWFAHDDHNGTKFGHGMGNGYALDCEPVGSGSCGFPDDEPAQPSQATAEAEAQAAVSSAGPEYGFYCYNPWAFYMAMSNHLRVNNDTSFLRSRAASARLNLTVEEALEGIVTDFEEYLIPGTNLVDYGPAMDGFSPTYKHVMPGCSQGNTVWMLRDFASFREAQGRSEEAGRLRKLAQGLSDDTMHKMYTADEDGKGFFNIIFPPDGVASLREAEPDAASSEAAKQLTVMEMRHVVDFFSVTFGLCGITQPQSAICDFSPSVRRELGDWFRSESVTSTWIRATSPKCNCSHKWPIPLMDGPESAPAPAEFGGGAEEWPAYPTCAAGRPDHGSDGAYPSWPAFALEALCYVDGNCSSAFEIMGTFAQATWEGPFGQAHQVPQLGTAPYTPFNAEPSFKPIAGVTRYIAIEGGSFFDSTLRGFFGYHAPLQWDGGASVQAQLDGTLHNPKTSRGFVGELSNLRTPHGLATIKSGAGGLSIALQKEP